MLIEKVVGLNLKLIYFKLPNVTFFTVLFKAPQLEGILVKFRMWRFWNMVTVHGLEYGERDFHYIQDQCNAALLAVCGIYSYSYLLHLGRC